MNLAETLKIKPIDNIPFEGEVNTVSSATKVVIKTINTFEYPTTKLLISAIEIINQDARRFSSELFLDKYGKFVEYSTFTSTPDQNPSDEDIQIHFSTVIYKNSIGEDILLVFAQPLNANVTLTAHQIL
jgi:hypothetical protein